MCNLVLEFRDVRVYNSEGGAKYPYKILNLNRKNLFAAFKIYTDLYEL